MIGKTTWTPVSSLCLRTGIIDKSYYKVVYQTFIGDFNYTFILDVRLLHM